MHVHPDALEDVEDRVIAIIEHEGEITLARLRDELDTSRKYAQAYLEHFDGAKLTLRRGDARVLRKRPPRTPARGDSSVTNAASIRVVVAVDLVEQLARPGGELAELRADAYMSIHSRIAIRRGADAASAVPISA